MVVAAEPEPALYSFPALAPGLAATPEEEEEDCAAHVLSMSNPGGGAYEVYDPVFDSAEETESSTKSSLELKRGETGGAYDAADAGKGGVWLEHADCREPTSPKGVREMRGGFWGGVRMRYDEWRCGAYWNKA